MKHLKPLNKKARLLEKAAEEGKAEEVHAMQTIAGCASTLDPGWEVDPLGGVAWLCQPMEADLYGCSDPCWWPAQAPDAITNRMNFQNQCLALERDWRNLNFVIKR